MREDAEEENSEKEDTDTSTMEQAAENVEDSDEEKSGQSANVAEDEESDEDGTKVAGSPPGMDPEDTDIPDTEYSPPLISAATAVAPLPGESPSSDWLTSPVQKYNPYTGRTTSAPLSFRLQEMVQELQAHSDWYEEHSPAALRPITIDLTTPEAPTSEPKKQSGQTQPGEKPHTLPGDTPTSPIRTRRHHPTATSQADNDGFIPVAGQRFASPAEQRTHPMDRQSTSSTTPSNRYAVLMETAVDTMNEHSRALENAAMERHRLRMERTQQEVQTAMEDALAHFHRVTAKQVVEHKNSIQDFCDQRTADMAEQLDNFTGEAERIRQEVLGRLQDGILEDRGGVPIEEEDVPQIPLPPNPAPQNKSPPLSRTDVPSPGTYSKRWGHIDLAPIPTEQARQPRGSPTPQLADQEAADHYLFKLRNTHTPTVLRSSDRKAVIKFYNAFADFLHQYRVPIKAFDQLRIVHLDDPDTTLYPDTLDPSSQLYTKYTTAIYARLEEDQVLDSSDQRFEGLLSMYSRTRDGYTMLKGLLAATLMTDAKDISQLSTPPPVDSTAHPYEYASQLDEFFQYQEKFERMYTPREQALMFLQGMRQVAVFTSAAAQLIHDLDQYSKTGPFPTRFHLANLPILLASHPAVTVQNPAMGTRQPTPARLYVTRASPMTAVPVEQHSSPAQTERTTPQRRGTTQQRGGTRFPRQPKDTQCAACYTYGHEVGDCRVLPKVAACLNYIKENSGMAQTTMQRYKEKQHPANRQTMNEMLVHAVYGHLGTQETDELNGLIEHLTDSLCSYTREEPEYDGNIFHVHATRPSDEYLEFDDICAATQAVKLPLIEDIRQERHECLSEVAGLDSETHRSGCITLSVTTIQQRDLADTGASVSATGIKEILHNFTTTTKYEITGYDGTVTKAAGEGYAHVHNDATQTVDRILFVYAPTITGTIFSLEHHAQTHPRIHKWTQEAVPSSQGGWITFYDKEQRIVSRYPTVRSKGVYFIQNMKFVPSTPSEPEKLESKRPVPRIDDQLTAADASRDDRISTAKIARISVDLPDDFTSADPLDGFTSYMSVPMMAVPCVTKDSSVALRRMTTHLHSTDQAILQYKIWHQRMGHPSETTLRKTQPLVDGIPPFTTKIPSVIRCRACDIAKLKRAPKGHNVTTSQLVPGQMFQMDIGFFRGPRNLQEVYDRCAEPQPKLVESRQGFVCCLLIVDRATRYIWVFPLRSRSVNLDLIDLFLRTHGLRSTATKIMRTDGEGSLAESGPFRRLLLTHGYVLEKTATDTSAQNGIAERPHRTLGEMTRCLLYSAQMSIIFWADAMVYSAYIYNRLYHETIEDVPYNAWTGKRANIKHMRAFGSRVIVKKSGPRPTKGDPHYYDGRFLRFTSTDRNLVYYDDVTHRDKTARHCTIDEFHFGSTDRPPGAQQVLKTIDPALVQRTGPPKEHILFLHEEGGIAPLPLDALDVNQDLREPTATSYTAQAASLFHTLSTSQQDLEAILHLRTDTNMYRTPSSIRLKMNNLPTMGFLLVEDADNRHVYLQGCQEGTQASRLPSWRRNLRHAILTHIQGQRVHTIQEVRRVISHQRQAKTSHVDFVFAKIEPRVQPDLEVPQMHYDQLRHVHELLISPELPSPEFPHMPDPLPAVMNVTRAKLKLQDDFEHWLRGEWNQLDKYELQNMFGDPIPWPDGATVLPFVWDYLLKVCPLTGNPIYKARGTCNGGKRFGKAVTLAETYATCVEQPASRIYWALTVSRCLLAMGADAGNAFAEAPPPLQRFYMRIDEQFRTWWTECKGRSPIPKNYVLPVNNALQGHPESPRLWEQHIHKILVENLHFTATTHEKCLYSRLHPVTSQLQLLLRQVDDFSVSADDQVACMEIIQEIGTHLKAPLNDLGIIQKFNGTNVLQTRWYIKIHCEDYLLKILRHHDWLDLTASNQPVPMRSDSKYHRQLELAERPQTAEEQKAVQTQAGFSYRTSIGELIYALVIARPEISMATTKLSQYNNNPAAIHYLAVKAVFAFLNNTRTDGLIFWRTKPRMDLPDEPLPTPYSHEQNALTPIPSIAMTPIGYSDSDWGSDVSHRRSVSGMVIMLSGAAVVYKTKFQQAVALSSTEAEFVSAADTGKMILYVRSILMDLGLLVDGPTDLHVDNSGAIFMINAQAPTKRTRHVDIRFFALLEWSASRQIMAVPIRTDKNLSDSLTKPTGRIKFHQHADVYMGRIPPTYATDAYPHLAPVLLSSGKAQQSLSAPRHNLPVSLSQCSHFLAMVSESMGG